MLEAWPKVEFDTVSNELDAVECVAMIIEAKERGEGGVFRVEVRAGDGREVARLWQLLAGQPLEARVCRCE